VIAAVKISFSITTSGLGVSGGGLSRPLFLESV